MHDTLYSKFYEQALETPNLICLKDDKIALTYMQVLYCIIDISQKLQTGGVKSGDVVALYSEKNIESLLCFFAISRLGATLLTLDPAFGANMITFIFTDAKVQWVIHNNGLPVKTHIPCVLLSSLIILNSESIQLINLDKTDNVDNTRQNNLNTHDIAWIVYSSGTTGNPKGIAISNQAMIGSIYSRYEFSDYEFNDNVACCIYFFWEIFRPLLRGASAYVIADKLLLDIRKYVKILQKNNITETLWTPSFAQMLLQCSTENELLQLKPLKRVWLNGEVVCSQLVNDLLQKLPFIKFYNLYSISETFDVAARELSCNLVKDGFASIGKPLTGVEALILDDEYNCCENFKHGELYVNSPFLAEGYLNRDDLQAQSFIKYDAISKDMIFFKTKDIAYKNDEGEIFILGRNDYIIKLRGYNISLLAIENVIKSVLPVKECVVTTKGDDKVSQIIVAALHPANEEEFIREYEVDINTGFSRKLQLILGHHLPEYAIPAKFFTMNAINRNDYSAKLDRKTVTQDLDVNLDNVRLKKMWHEILQVPLDIINEKSDFFSLGANSLHVMQYVQLFKIQFNLEVNVADIYQHSGFGEHLQWILKNIVKIDENIGVNLHDINCDELFFKNANAIKPPRHENLLTAKNVFITGVTGFLGAHWLHSLLVKTTGKYYCLVRAKNAEQGMLRLIDNFKKYNFETAILHERIVIVAGALEDEYFGLSDKNWNFLTENIDIILHAGAVVNLLASYKLLKPSGIDGTKTLLKLATTQYLKPTILISSDAVLYQPGNLPDKHDRLNNFLPEDTIKNLTYGYAKVKWGQEKLLEQVAKTCNLPFLIVRLGNLAPSLSTGIANSSDANHLLIKIMTEYKVIPDKISLEFTPVDKMVNCLTTLCCNDIKHKILSLTGFNIVDKSLIASFFSEKLSVVYTDISDIKWQELIQNEDPFLASLWQIDELFTSGKVLHKSVGQDNFRKLLELNFEQLQNSLYFLSKDVTMVQELI